MLKIHYGLKPEAPQRDELARALWTVSMQNATIQEEWILLHVRPAPWWCPKGLWRRLVAQVLRIERQR